MEKFFAIEVAYIDNDKVAELIQQECDTRDAEIAFKAKSRLKNPYAQGMDAS